MLFYHGIYQRALAVQATDPGAATTRGQLLPHRVLGVDLVQIPDWALVGVTRVVPSLSSGIRRHGANGTRHTIRIIPHVDGIVIGLRHFLSIEARQFRVTGQQRFGFGQNCTTAPFQVAQQAFPLFRAQVPTRFQQFARALAGRLIPILQPGLTGRSKTSSGLLAELGDGLLGLLFELSILAKDVIEAAGNFPGQLHVGHLVFSDWDPARSIHQYVRTLQQRVTQKAVGC